MILLYGFLINNQYFNLYKLDYINYSSKITT